MPNVVAALPYTGGALCSTPQFGCAIRLPRRETVEIAGVPQTNETISAAGGPEFTTL